MTSLLPPTVILVPVKSTHLGKSRLAGLPDAVRRELALAFALDVLTAAAAATLVGRVVAVTDDADVATHAARLGCHVAPDTGGLNRSLVTAASALPEGCTVVAICADLPAADAEDLDELIRRLPATPAMVPDAVGTGTTVYAAPQWRFEPAFGPGSRRAHERRGAVAVGLSLWGLRSDVDTIEDLRTAAALGVGTHTASLLDRAIGRSPHNAARGPRRSDGPAVAR